MKRSLSHAGLFLALTLLAAMSVAKESGMLLPEIPPSAKGDECVEPTEIMRRDHMRFLMHQRDDTVHGGIRGAKHSLVGCIECHAQSNAQGAAIPVNAEGQFCQSCHSFTGVRMDCFECHAAVPAERQSRNARSKVMSAQALCFSKAAFSGVN